MILQTLTLLDMKAKGATVLRSISTALSSRSWMSTQTTAYCLVAVSKFAKMGGTSNDMNCTYKINNSTAVTFNGKMPLKQVDMGIKGGTIAGKAEIQNNGKGILFARIITEGIPETGDQTSVESDLKLSINYTKMDGSDLNPEKLSQGTDFIAVVSITNPGTRGEYMQMALSQIFPSGWEIHNTRMDEAALPVKSDYPTYQDIRDDRVYTYFDISPTRTKTFRIILNAAYVGRFYLPTVYCEAMYDNTVNARKPGQWVEVVKAGEIN